LAEKPQIQSKRYLSYLLRLWQESNGGASGEAPLWRASLEKPQTGDRLGFASLADLFAFLENETRAGRPSLQHQHGEGS
jgi:hypothetical protein